MTTNSRKPLAARLGAWAILVTGLALATTVIIMFLEASSKSMPDSTRKKMVEDMLVWVVAGGVFALISLFAFKAKTAAFIVASVLALGFGGLMVAVLVTDPTGPGVRNLRVGFGTLFLLCGVMTVLGARALVLWRRQATQS